MQKDALYKSQNLTNADLLKIFKQNYPMLKVEDYRPLCPQLFTDGLVGITIWLENGDTIQYYPHQRASKEK